MFKQIPNILTLCNLFFGCLAIVAAMQSGVITTFDVNSGQQIINIPEQIYLASLFIAIAAVIDFLDGFVARLFKATSEMGKQLDSLSDVVSFGVAPSMIVYQFLQFSMAKYSSALTSSNLLTMPAFIIACAGAYRLARFNIDASQSTEFKGVPIPAIGLLIASFPLIKWHSNNQTVINILLNEWFWYALILIVSFLMISTMPIKALKFKEISVKALLPFVLVLVAAIVTAIFFGWLCVPISFIIYLLVNKFM